MDATGSFIKTVLERARFYLDDPDGDAKYTNDFLVRHTLMPCLVEVISQLNLDADNPIIARFTITPTTGIEAYALPPDIQMVVRVAKYDTNGNLIWESCPRGIAHPCGPGWSLQPGFLYLRPFPQGLESFTIDYIPTGNICINYSVTGASYARTGSGATAIDTCTLPVTPTYGMVDPRPNAYVGSVFRVLGAGLWEERIITAHNATTRTITMNVPFTTLPSINTSCEIAPVAVQPLWEAIALSVAMKLGTAKNISGVRMENLRRLYSKAMKSVSDISSNIQAVTGKYYQRATTMATSQGLYGPSGI